MSTTLGKRTGFRTGFGALELAQRDESGVFPRAPSPSILSTTSHSIPLSHTLAQTRSETKNLASDATPSNASAQFSWNSIPELTTCTTVLFTWVYSGPDDGTVDITITNSGVNQDQNTPARPPVGRAAATASEVITTSYLASKEGIPWLEVDVPPGWYVILGTSPSFLAATSLPFFVSNGSDTSCINPLFLSSSTSANITASADTGTSLSTPSSTVSSLPSALPSQDNRMNEIIAGSVGGGLILIIFIGVCATLISRNIRRRSHPQNIPRNGPPPPHNGDNVSEKDYDDDSIHIAPPNPVIYQTPGLSYDGRSSSALNNMPGVESFGPPSRQRVDSSSSSRTPSMRYVPKMNFSLPNSPVREETFQRPSTDQRRNKPSVSETIQSKTYTLTEEGGTQEEDDITPAYPSGVSMELSQLSTVVASTVLGKKSDVSGYSRPSSVEIHMHPFSTDPVDSSEKGYNLQDPSLSYGEEVTSPLRVAFSPF